MVNAINKVCKLDSDYLFKIVSEDSNDLIAILNQESKFEYINSKAHEKLTGYTEEDLIGKSAPDLIHPKDHKKALKRLQNIYLTGSEEGEIRLKCKDGNFIWVLMKGMRFVDEDDKVKILMMAKEISKLKRQTSAESEERFKEMCDNLTEIRFWKFLQPKQAIAAYQESQAMLKLIMDSIPQYITWKDINLVYMGCNTNFIKLMGFNEEKDIIGKMDYELGWGEETAVALQLKDKSIIESDNAVYHITELWEYKGNQIWFDVNRIPLHDLEGKVVGILVTYDDITDHKKADEALKSSEQKYRDLTELLPETIYEADLDYNVTYVNSSGLTKFGYTAEDLKKGINVFDAFAPEEVKNVKENLMDLFKTNIAEPHEYLMKNKNGIQFYGRIISVPIYKDGKPNGIRGIIHDITESKLAEQKLKESEEKYRHLFNSTPYAIWLVNLKGIIIDCNITMNNFLSIYTREDIIGKNIREVLDLFISKGDPIFKELEPVFLERFKKIIRGDKLEPLELKVSRADGKIFWITFESSFVNVGNETLLQVFIKDISERKETELKIQESEEKYRLISENANDLIFILDVDGKFTYCNDTFKKILGYNPEELLGRFPIEFAHPEDKENILSDFKKGIMGYSGTNVSRFICKDGTFKWLESIGNISYDNEGNPIKMFTVSRDITERKMMEEKLIQSEEELKVLNKELEQKVKERTKELEEKNLELQKLDKIKDEFITHAAHELKTPLISIAGYTDYILYRYKDIEPEIKEDLLIVQRNIERLHRLMNQLLEVMKIESEKMELNKEIVNVSDIIINCIKELSYLIKEKNHEINVEIKDQIKLNVDPERIFQVLSNLLSNAIKFTPQNGKIEIKAKDDDAKENYIFEISDSGIGLSQDELERLFKKFELVKQISEGKYKKGTGLGLHISKGFIEAHGGKMWASSEGLNRGTTIHFTLPITI
ncbi:MAG: PAS domain S-box protein [Promethearchaeota archaeon]|nr:MAG: PAS domain S-box protein [Candidatus Lokiarchaeota archaeon]